MLCDSSWLVWGYKKLLSPESKILPRLTKWLSMTSSTGPSCSAASSLINSMLILEHPDLMESPQRFSMTFNNRSWSHRVSMLIIAHPYSKTSCKGLCALILQSFTVPSKPALHTCPGHETELESGKHGKVESMIMIDKDIGRREIFWPLKPDWWYNSMTCRLVGLLMCNYHYMMLSDIQVPPSKSKSAETDQITFSMTLAIESDSVCCSRSFHQKRSYEHESLWGRFSRANIVVCLGIWPEIWLILGSKRVYRKPLTRFDKGIFLQSLWA